MDGEPNGNSDEKRVTRWDDLMKPEQEQSERQFVRFEELEPIFADKNGLIMGHGTASAGNDHDVVESILREGLRTFQATGSQIGEHDKDEVVGDRNLKNTAISLFSAYDGSKPVMSDIKDVLDHWRHRDAENVILIRIPVEFINKYTSSSEERFLPFYTQKRDDAGQMRYFLDPRLIIGNYNRETGLVEMNDQFQTESDEEFRSELRERLEEAKKESEERMESNSLEAMKRRAMEAERYKNDDEEVEEDPIWGKNNIDDVDFSDESEWE